MPYICLARNDIPDGTLQVTDLWPNVSLRNNSIDPPGQTRYFRRVRNDNVNLNAVTGLGSADRGSEDMDGIRAYLADRVEPGGLTAETMTLTFTLIAVAGDRIVIDGPGAGPAVVLTAAVATDTTAPQTWAVADGGGGENGAAAFVTLFNSDDVGGTVQTDITAAIGAGHTLTAVAVLNVVTITAQTRPGRLYLQSTMLQDDGAGGDASARLAIAGGTVVAAQTVRMQRAVEAWTTTTVTTAATALIARVDAGSTLALADVNTVLTAAAAGTELSSAGSSDSVGTVLELLSILAGRSYVLPANSPYLEVALLPDFVVYENARSGDFVDVVSTFDSQMLNGEIRPSTPFTKFPNNSHARSHANNVSAPGGAVPGDATNVERANVRYNVDGDSIQSSLQSGQLSRMQGGAVTLFPDNDFSAFHESGVILGAPAQTAEVINARLVTVYDNDGSLL